MRLWSFHPKYLDFPKGLGGLWKESLQASRIIINPGRKMKHYNHPQTIRFKKCAMPITSITLYLNEVYKNALTCRTKKGNVPNYNRNLIPNTYVSLDQLEPILVTDGQIAFEWDHLMHKLKKRDVDRYNVYKFFNLSDIELNPVFKLVPGPIEFWEKGKHAQLRN